MKLGIRRYLKHLSSGGHLGQRIGHLESTVSDLQQHVTRLEDCIAGLVSTSRHTEEVLLGEMRQVMAVQHASDAAMRTLAASLPGRDEARLAAGFELAATRFAPVALGQHFYHGLKSVGVLNFEDEWASGERRFLSGYLRHYPDAVVFDVGANTGHYSRTVRELAPHAEIFCFEPQPSSLQELRGSADELRLKVHPVALGEREGVVELYDYADRQGSEHASLYRAVIEDIHKGQAAAPVPVRCKTVDGLVAELNVDRIGLLKIDTEGHELSILRGARECLADSRIDVIQFEFNEMNVVSRVFMKDFFDLLPGYRLHRLLPDSSIELRNYDPVFMEIFAYQNIVCVRDGIDCHWLTSKAAFPPA